MDHSLFVGNYQSLNPNMILELKDSRWQYRLHNKSIPVFNKLAIGGRAGLS